MTYQYVRFTLIARHNNLRKFILQMKENRKIMNVMINNVK